MPPLSDNSKNLSLYTISLTPPQQEKLLSFCNQQLWESYQVNHALFAFRGPNVNLVLYSSGKLVIQGKGTQDFIHFTLEPTITQSAQLGYDKQLHPEWFSPHGGLDESGKGDLFGPVVSGCVLVDNPSIIENWVKIGVQDSKNIKSESKIFDLEQKIINSPGVISNTIFSSMPRYNELYLNFGSNLNKYLGWLHAKNLSECLKQKSVPWVLLDQFSKQPIVQWYMKDNPTEVRMRTHAEDDPVVAAASILARAGYLKQMQKLSQLAGETLLKGASNQVLQQAKRIAQNPSLNLENFAKMHFRTAQIALGKNPSLFQDDSL